jgi:PAS domain S-box-containing protein
MVSTSSRRPPPIFDLRRIGLGLGAGLNAPIQVGFLLVIAVLVASTWLSFHHTRVLYESQTSVVRSQAVIAQVRAVHATLVEAEAGARGFAITDADEEMRQFEAARERIGKQLDQLAELARAGGSSARGLDVFDARAKQSIAWLARTVDVASTGGTAEVARLMQTGEGEKLLGAVRAVIEDIERFEQRELEARVESSRKSYETAHLIIVLVGVGSLLLVCALYQFVRRFDRLRDRAARDAAASEERFRVTLSSIGDAVLVADSEGRLTFVNAAVASVAGLRADVLGRRLEEVLTWVTESTGASRASPAERALLEPGVVRTGPDAAIVLPEGGLRPVEATAASIRGHDGTVLGVVVVLRDMSVRRQAEHERQRIADRYRSLVLATAQIVWTADRDGWVKEDSPLWRHFTGQTYEQWKGHGWLDALHPEDRERVRSAWQASVAAVRPFEVECRMRKEAGGYGWCLARAVPVLDPHGGVREWVGMIRDIQPRKEVEAAQRDASRRKDEFIALLAHELRNPLAPLRNGLSLLERGLPEDRKRAIEMMGRQLRHMVRLIDDLLDASRISQGRLELRMERFDLCPVLRQAVEVAEPTIEAKHQRLTVNLPECPLWLDGDPIRVAQVVSNLLNNASKYSDPEASIWLNAEREGTQVLVSVRDTGNGIAPEMQPRIWDLFLQGDGHLERTTGGLGIGLTLVKRLVEMHGGKAEVFSEGLGCGSEFVVRLPGAGPPPEARPSGPAVQAEGLAALLVRPLRILIIDDNEDSAESLGMLLRMGGHDVRLAFDGGAGLDAMEAFDPELVLCDIRMPGLSGYDVARRLRGRGKDDRTLLVALTGFGTTADRDQSADAGFDHHLVKPVDLESLARVLEHAAARTRSVP